MKLGIIADTHIDKNLDRLEQVKGWLSEADLIIHVGDFTSIGTIQNLLVFKGLVGVWGDL